MLGLAFGVSANPGYLPVVGPAALRFRPVAQSANNLVRMPLPPTDPPPPAPPSTPSTPPAAAVTEAKTPPPAAAPSSAPVLLAPANSPVEPDTTPSASEPKISPQMLLRYFNRSTNGTTSGVIAPVDFAPPAAILPSSTATYTTDPK
jgi:hypothetical protein